MTAEVIALTLTAVVHIVGAVVLVWAMFDNENRPDWRGLWPRDDDEDGGDGGWGRGPVDPPAEGPSGGGLPFPEDAVPARLRLREPGRLADAHPRPARRPGHAPAPVRVPSQR